MKKGSEKTFKLATADKLAASITTEEEPSAAGSVAASVNSKLAMPTTSAVQANASGSNSSHQTGELEAEEEVTFELPPPMKPIQDSQSIHNNGPNVSSATVAEQSPCKRVRLIPIGCK